MLNNKKKLPTILGVILALPFLLLILLLIVGIYLYKSANFLQPNVEVDLDKYVLSVNTDSTKVCTYGSMHLNKYGLWETRLYGEPINRGAAYGVMSKDLLEFQESVFVNQIHEIISSEIWVNVLHKLTAIFNRNMAKHIPLEYREEIYAMSLSCTNKYNSYGPPYARQLNYHAAHDIGHAMQQYMLVGCSSFAIWDKESEDGGLLIGRNFDFYVGDDFARNKVILFVEPEDGHNFVSVSWPGMMGVLSGMNERGLTVTINAAKGPIPTSSAMPISLLARHILQYATNISEAYEIAKQFQTFVSESLLIGSAEDGYAAIIEKTPTKVELYKSPISRVVCTNHYQSESFQTDGYNQSNIETSDSPYRFKRVNQLLDELNPINTDEAIYILRNRYGINNEDIGICNEKSLNQFIAHHSVVFQPNELRIWVSTSPWQLGEYVCYDLDEIFTTTDNNVTDSHAIDSLNIPAESLQLKNEFNRAIKYRKQYVEFQRAIKEQLKVEDSSIKEFIANNPTYFQVYNILGDYMMSIGNVNQAICYWKKALSLEISRLEEKEQITNKIKKYD